jgi:trigger factor
VEFGDLVALDIESLIDGKPFFNQNAAQYLVVRDSPFPAPGFSQQLTGMKKGEIKEFKLQLPSDYPRSELAGKEPSFKVRVIEIKQEILPELNDEFAKQLGPKLETVAALRDEVTQNLKLRAEEKARISRKRWLRRRLHRLRWSFPRFWRRWKSISSSMTRQGVSRCTAAF